MPDPAGPNGVKASSTFIKNDRDGFAYTFARRAGSRWPTPLKLDLHVGESVVVSGQGEGEVALVNGWVARVDDTVVTVVCREPLVSPHAFAPEYTRGALQHYPAPPSTPTVGAQGQRKRRRRPVTIEYDAHPDEDAARVRAATALGVYRVDVDDRSLGMNTSFANLSALCSGQSEPLARLRRLIIDLDTPAFTGDQTPSQADQRTGGQWLNQDQEHALDLTLRAQDYALVLGMPVNNLSPFISFLRTYSCGYRLCGICSRRGSFFLAARNIG